MGYIPVYSNNKLLWRKMKKQLIMTALTAALVSGGVYATTQVSAHFGQGNDEAVSRLAKAFGKSEEEVREVFEEMRGEHHLAMQQALEERLNEAVASGELSDEQVQLIITKHGELKAEHEAAFDALNEMSPEERRETMQGHRDEMRVWAMENGIEWEWLEFGGEGMHGKGMGRVRNW